GSDAHNVGVTAHARRGSCRRTCRRVHGMRFRVILLAFLLAAGARASSVTDEIGVNTTQATDSNPRSGNVSDSLNAALDLTDHWSLNLGALVTLEGQTPAAEKGAFGSSGSAVSLFSLGVDWDATDSLTLGANVQWSPQSTQYAGTQISLLGGVNANALL